MRYVLLFDLVQAHTALCQSMLTKAAASGKYNRAKLEASAQQIRRALVAHAPRVTEANKAWHAQAQAAKLLEPFTATWRTSGKVEQLTGWAAASALTGYSEATLRNYFSRGKGVYHTRKIADDGIIDDVTIVRVNYKPGKGRPAHTHKETYDD